MAGNGSEGGEELDGVVVGTRAHKTHLASTVPPIMGESPSVPLVETLCNRYCPERVDRQRTLPRDLVRAVLGHRVDSHHVSGCSG